MNIFLKFLNFLVRYAGLVSAFALIFQTFTNRARLKIIPKSICRYIGGSQKFDEGILLTVPNFDSNVLSFKIFLENYGKWPCNIRTWELKIGTNTFVNFESYPNNMWLPTESGDSTILSNSNVFTPINEMDSYVIPFKSIKVSVDFIIPSKNINAKNGELSITYSTYSFFRNRPKKAVLKFKIPQKPTYIE